jgi:hypothetical protein
MRARGSRGSIVDDRVARGVLHHLDRESNARVVDIVSSHPYISLTSPHSTRQERFWMATRKKSKARTKKKATKRKAKKKAGKRKAKKKAGKKKRAGKKRRSKKAAAPAADAGAAGM